MPQPETTEAILAELVQFDSVSHLSNRPIIMWLKDYLESHGLEPHIIERHDDPDKLNLFVTFSEGVEGAEGGICFSGHTDVVPAEAQPWTVPPFALTEKDDKLYGRGTCDMKGYLACVLSQIPKMKAAKTRLPFHGIFSCDEEIGCEGVISAIEAMGTRYARPDIIIVGEPTSMKTVSAHKSIYHYITKIRGLEAHSSKPALGSNAVVIGAAIVEKLDEFAQTLKAEPDPLFDPPYATLHIGMFKGGIQQNIVPGEAEISWEIRGLPSQDPSFMVDRLHAWLDHELLSDGLYQGVPASAETELVSITLPFAHKEGNAAEQLVQRVMKSNQVSTVPYGTEAGQFQTRDLDTVIIGPGSIDQAHKPDEFIEISQLRACEAFIDDLIESVRI